MLIDKKYCFGNTVFRIIADREMISDSRFEAFSVDTDTEEDFIYEIFQYPEDNVKRDEPVRLERKGNRIRVYMNIALLPGINLANFLSVADASHLLIEKGSFILHSSYICHDGKAILFTAPSGTGKSTQARHWCRLRQGELINEDRTIITQKDGVFYANGCWAMGSGNISRNVTVPIRAIVMLGQGRENVVSVPKPNEIIRRIIPQCTFDATKLEHRIRIIDNVSAMIGAVSIVAFDCLDHDSAVEELEKYI